MKKSTIAILAGILVSGCADQIEEEIIDYCELNYQNCEAALVEDNCLTKTPMESCIAYKDTPDCIIGEACPNSASESDAYQGNFNGNKAAETGKSGYIGVIDRKCHNLNSVEVGGDVDIIPIKAEPGTSLKVQVFRTNISKIQPVLYLKSKAGGNLIYSLPDIYGNTTLSFIVPDDLFYVSIEEKSNLDIDYSSTCDDSLVTGGSRYQYIVKVENNPELSLIPIGSFENTTVTPKTMRFTASGQSHYYEFTTKAGKTPTVIVEPLPDSPSESQPVVTPLSKNAPSGSSFSSWVLHGPLLKKSDLGETGYNDNYQSYSRIAISQEYGDCSSGYCKYTIAITDYEGHYGYDYQLTISDL